MAMNISPVEAEAFRLLRDDLYQHLLEAEYLATQNDTWSEEQAERAHEVIPDLVTVIRGLVVMHEGPEECTTCHKPWPCVQFATIHQLVKDPDRLFGKLLTARREEIAASGIW
jgi:hypothetical protein